MDEDFKDPFEYNDIIPLDFKNKSGIPQVFEEIYKNTENIKIDWRKRELALKKIGRICLGNFGKSEIFLQFFNGQIYTNLGIQLGDLRSSLMKEACKIVSLCARELNTLIEAPLAHMMSQYVLFKIAGNTNKVIADNCAKCILNIIKYVHSVKIIINVCEQKILKANFVRVIVAQCLYYIMCLYKKSLILKTIGIFLDTIKSLLSDPNSEVRATSRRVFLAYKKRFPDDAEEFFKELEKSVQKQIIEDEKIFWDFTFIKVDDTMDNESTPVKKNKILYGTDKKAKSEEVRYIQPKNLNNEINDSNNNNNNEINNIENNNNENNNTNDNNNLNDTNTNTNNNSSLQETFDEKKEEKKEPKFTNLNILRQQKNSRKNKSLQKRTINRKTVENTSSGQKRHTSEKKEHGNNSAPKKKESNEQKINNNTKKKTATEEKILILIKKLDEINNVNDKLLVFQYLFNDFTQILKDINTFSEVSIRKFIDIHIEFLGEEEKALISQVIKNLMRMIFYTNQIFNNYDIESIVKILLNLLNKNNGDTDIEKSLCKLIVQLFEVMRRKCNNEELLKILFSILKESDNDNENNENNNNYITYNNYDYETCYEWMASLVPSCNNIFTNLNTFKKYLRKICSSCNINSIKIILLIDTIYKLYTDIFILAYNDETENNQNKLLTIMEKNNSKYYQDLLNKIKSKSQNIKSIMSDKNVATLNNNNNNNNNVSAEGYDYEEVPKEIIEYLEKGDVNSFKAYLENHKNLVPSFLLLLSNSNYNKNKYVDNLINFTYSLISTGDTFIPDLEQVIELFINQVVHLLLTNKKNKIILQTTKEILMITPSKLNTEKFFKTISQYLNMKNDSLLLECLLLSVKYFIINNKTQNLEKLLPYFIEEVINLINHQTKEVKEQAVFCCVEIIMVIGHKFDVYFDMLPKNQQNLINFFIKKRTG